MKFKVGDKVQVIDLNKCISPSFTPYVQNQVYIIWDIDDYSDNGPGIDDGTGIHVFFRSKDNMSFWDLETNLKLAYVTETPLYKAIYGETCDK